MSEYEGVSIESGTLEWLRWRRGGIGGSDAPVITGDSPFLNELELWLDKRGLLPLEQKRESEPMYWGRKLEPAVIDRFETQTGLLIVDRQSCIQSSSQPWRRATIDGWVAESRHAEGALGIYEGKTASRRTSEWADGVPLYVQVQCQHNMDIAAVDLCWVGVLLTAPAIHFEVFELERDDAAIAILRRLEQRFWDRVLQDVPPPASSGDVDALRAAFSETIAGSSIELPLEAAELALTIRIQQGLVKQHTAQLDAAEAQLMELMREHEIATVDGKVIATWKRFERRYTDLDAMRAAHKEIVEQFTSKRASRRFTVAKSDEEGE